jgi:hypothetical protein
MPRLAAGAVWRTLERRELLAERPVLADKITWRTYDGA